MNSIIIDDDPISIELISELCKNEKINILKTFQSANEALEYDGLGMAEVIFLDIEMPGMTGYEFIGNLKDDQQVIIVSGNHKHALDGYEKDVTDFLLKPVTLERFKKAKQKLIERNKLVSQNAVSSTAALANSPVVEFTFIKYNNKLVKLFWNDIYYIEATGDYISINTKQQRYVILLSMKEAVSKIPPHLFSRIHRSYIVNLEHIDNITDKSLELGQTSLPIGRSFKADLISKLSILNV